MIAEAKRESPDDSGEKVVFETVLLPHRSLSPAGFLAVMAALIGLSIAIGVGFTMAGAWPVIGFFGLDVILVYVVFRMSYRAARQSELVRLTASQLEVTARDGSGGIHRAVLQPYWARVDLEPASRGHPRLMVRSHGHALELGSFLGPDEKAAFAAMLLAALRRVKSTPA